MSKTLLRAIFTAAVLIAALPGAAFAASVDLNIYSMTGSPDPITLGTGNVPYTVTINHTSTSSMTVTPDPVTLGTGDVQFLVQFTNNSTSQATNAVLTSTIPVNSTFVSATTPVGSGSCSQSAGTVTCSWGSIGASSTYYAYI